MRDYKVFIGNSHPELGNLVCQRLGVEPAPCVLKKFVNGETSVQIGVSVRDEDVYVIQSSSNTLNDHIMELLIMVSAFSGGSAGKVTAVIPMFPYSKQSKMKKHRGAITARMLANLLIMAGADHVISMDLHSSQMQGFFSKPVDNLYGGPSLARWIKENVEDYENAVVVSKNPGGTKRVTALADSLKINFAMIHTDRRRSKDLYSQNRDVEQLRLRKQSMLRKNRPIVKLGDSPFEEENIILSNGIQTARIRNGHVISDDEIDTTDFTGEEGFLTDSLILSSNHNEQYGLCQNYEGTDDEEEEEEGKPDLTHGEKLITLVGSVENSSAIILDDMIDRPTSFVSAAEHLVQNCGAKKVYVIATHGVFIGDCLQQLEQSEAIHKIVVTNSYPIPKEHIEMSTKLEVIDVSAIFAECIRRDHNGESISVLFDSLAVS
ncbi:hypothetical protein Kpol_1001p30 [Vanderwaltozyma polyspora DSM 70294]|uniref:Ribose-phosphate pyrophosphokinase 1 n=1 Tax=Vanderwaltozyma polyspora (strain ATCC 22028 / DSM 70294 / BCRC 21397 / CBS 2163 / NBRC 10782 / NRRL Y-8283 / UCD 57-17) TaxID=436907 RepID=A7TNR7_VANPO|nr:uncharacterized protein Kpol_1001p30 [Vanderwaltozyma polyspora DSM 70294]EDO16118.1 hypothetical protein Kpol_1001p30 [Vanderwaltozyma polyspora DSM 70294]